MWSNLCVCVCVCLAQALWQAGLRTAANTGKEFGSDASRTSAEFNVAARAVHSLGTGNLCDAGIL